MLRNPAVDPTFGSTNGVELSGFIIKFKETFDLRWSSCEPCERHKSRRDTHTKQGQTWFEFDNKSQ